MIYKNKTIKKRNNTNTWWTRIRTNGEQITISGKTQKECLEKLKKYYKQNETKKINDYTFEQWQAKWMELYKQDCRETTKKLFIYYKKYTKEINDTNIKKIKEIDIIQILNKIEAPRQKQKIYEYLKDIFNKAEQNKFIDISPISLIQKPKYEKNTAGKVLTINEEKIFINECKKHKYGNFFIVTLLQGLRKGETLGIKRENIDYINKKLTITSSINDNTKETQTKNKYSNRTIPLFDTTLKILEQYKNIPMKERLFKYNTKSLHLAKKEIINNSNIPYVRTHDLRHTFITRCKENNIPEHIIQSWVGHEIGSNITAKVYTHKTNESDKENYNIINKYLNEQEYKI